MTYVDNVKQMVQQTCDLDNVKQMGTSCVVDTASRHSALQNSVLHRSSNKLCNEATIDVEDNDT